MSNLFGTEQPDLPKARGDREVAKFDGKRFYEFQLRLRDKHTARVIFLGGLDDSLAVWVHKPSVKVGNAWREPVCGRKNKHLFAPYECPFCNHPDEARRKLGLNRFVLAYVVSYPQNPDLVGKVVYFQLAFSQLQAIQEWEKIETEDKGELASVKGHKVALTRTGATLNTTQYSAVVGELTPLPKPMAELQPQVDFLVTELKRVYTWDEKFLKTVFDNALQGDSKKAPAEGNVPSGKEPEEEIAF